jgi:hypothetical protein
MSDSNCFLTAFSAATRTYAGFAFMGAPFLDGCVKTSIVRGMRAPAIKEAA